MEFTKYETRTLDLAISVAIEKETKALEGLGREIRDQATMSVIAERTQHIRELDRLRERIRSESN
jgi:hypothetical protein